MSQGPEKPQNYPFALPFGYFPHSFPKHRKTLQIVRQLVLSSSIRLARIKMLANEGPRTKLGYDRYSDSVFDRCVDTRKSIIGYVFLLVGGAVSWKSVK